MSIINWKKDDNVAIITMNAGENRHNPDFAKAMKSTYEEILADEAVHAVVLTSSDPKNFCLGVDINWLLINFQQNNQEIISEWLYNINEVFRFFIMCPFPSIAAITGHAFGNGALLALACDYRFMRSDRGFLCLPEMDLNIQFTPSMLQWVKKSLPRYLMMDMILSGRKVTATELEAHHVLRKACPDAETTFQEALSFAKTFHKSRKTMEEMKKRINKPIMDAMLNEDPKYISVPIFMTTV
ncbi:MAG: enoyl-CoA hydratase/isomerase family protein [Desulfobacterales bacterium]|nr:enoyl-CoA hydratase/isomerase family protein [Desulfobacterales bacterium]